MGRYFSPEQATIAGLAFQKAERIAFRHFRIDKEMTQGFRYDVKTLAYLDQHEVKESAFAHLCKYEYGDGYFYRICLQDNRILDAVMRAQSFIKLGPLLLYIAMHELVHVIRFDSGDADFDVPNEEKVFEEEKVHSITVDMLQSCINPDLKLVMDCFSSRYQIGDMA